MTENTDESLRVLKLVQCLVEVKKLQVWYINLNRKDYINLNRKDFVAKKNIYVCNEQFEYDVFERGLHAETLKSTLSK